VVGVTITPVTGAPGEVAVPHARYGEQDGVPEVGVTITTVHRAPVVGVPLEEHARYGEHDGVPEVDAELVQAGPPLVRGTGLCVEETPRG